MIGKCFQRFLALVPVGLGKHRWIDRHVPPFDLANNGLGEFLCRNASVQLVEVPRRDVPQTAAKWKHAADQQEVTDSLHIGYIPYR